jgi:hypothetical protein
VVAVTMQAGRSADGPYGVALSATFIYGLGGSMLLLVPLTASSYRPCRNVLAGRQELALTHTISTAQPHMSLGKAPRVGAARHGYQEGRGSARRRPGLLGCSAAARRLNAEER